MLPRTSRIVALCSAANFINAADRVIMPIAIVLMTDEFKWNLYWQGWILSAFAFGYFTSQVRGTKSASSLCFEYHNYCPPDFVFPKIIGGSTASRFGCKTVLMFAVMLWSISTVMTPLVAQSVPLLIACRVVLGLGEGLGVRSKRETK